MRAIIQFSALLAVMLFGSGLTAQSFHWGPEVQVYPTGVIPTIAIEHASFHDALNIRFGYNLVNHRDLGVQDDERGGGFGGSLAYFYFLKDYGRGLFVGGRADLWRNTIKWKDQVGTPQEVRGTSKIFVLQPTALAGFAWDFGPVQFRPNVAFGAELNVKTEGREVGHGAILLVGVQVLF
ncbi:MAG: hypothetical protein KDC28_06285 [Saprospiraceae bacterium]|nr:hypothetical protein [Saprospiraceae bacterium]MCB9321224.1 hypothetical protein [Lewinellaceae bacterium]